jgi:CRP/FNR family transcriptional regulator, cyclic AMP receptor protein
MSSSVSHNSDEGVPTMLSFLKRQTEPPRIRQIRLLNLFATLNQRELRIIDGLLHDRHYLKDEVVFDHGEEGQALYVVLSGKVLICRQGEPVTGRIAEIPAGALFGELALLDGAPRVAQARAAEDSVLAALSRADFTRLMETHGWIASKIALQLARDLGQKLVAVNSAMEKRPR